MDFTISARLLKKNLLTILTHKMRVLVALLDLIMQAILMNIYVPLTMGQVTIVPILLKNLIPGMIPKGLFIFR